MFSVNSLPRVFRHIRNLLILLSPVAVAAAFACDSQAATITWTGYSSGLWTNSSNWSTSAVPTSTDDVILTNGPYSLSSLGGAAAADSLTFSNGSTPIGLGTLNDYVLSVGSGGITADAAALADTINSSLALTASQTWTNNSPDTFTLAGNLNTNGYSLTVAGAGNTVLSGSVGGSGGIVNNGAGILTLNGPGNSFTGGLTLNNGTTLLDYSVNNNAKFDPSSPLALGNATLQFNGNATPFTQGAGTLTLPAAAAGAVYSPSGNTTLALAGINRGVGSTLYFNLPAGSVTLPPASVSNGILGAWATVTNTGNAADSGFATLGPNNQVLALAPTAQWSAGYTGSDTDFVLTLSSSVTPLDSGSIGTLTISNPVAQAAYIALNGGDLAASGILLNGNSGPVWFGYNGNALTAENPNHELFLYNYSSQVLYIEEPIADNASGLYPGPTNLVIGGSGNSVTLMGVNTYTGTTYIGNGSTLRFGKSGNIVDTPTLASPAIV